MLQATSMASTFSSSSSWTYDVFLNFRGKDTRNNFVAHLNSALVEKGIHTFIDDKLIRGEDISHELIKAIEESMISIVIFSENYASSKWCLDELVKIHHCRKTRQQIVMPVFYKVDPSEVRNQKTGSFGKAIAKHERMFKDKIEKVQRWRAALSEASNLSGFHFLDGGDESQLIQSIITEISPTLSNRAYLDVAMYPVGLESYLEDMDELLGVGGNDICMVGIWGICGIGKTTIAKALYNSIAHKFEGSCFLKNVRENSLLQHGGLAKLQETLLFDILRDTNLKVTNVDRGVNIIKNRLSRKKVLLILDDVNELEQLYNLAGGPDWFGNGSRIVITTKDRHLLTAHQIHIKIYGVKGLDRYRAFELFCWNAFKINTPLQEYQQLIEDALDYAQGLPLALTILGSHLCGRSTNQWKAALDSYKRIPNKKIQDILKISYDGLEDPVKTLFLDIACFCKGRSKDDLIHILEDWEIGIQVLWDKALVTIENHKIQMHDLVEDMGKEIVRQESPTEPGKRSRLWFHEDIYHVLTQCTGTDQVTGIMLTMPEPNDEIHLGAESFSKMKNLRFFINRNAYISGDVNYLSNKLKLLHWHNYPSESLPSKFDSKKLVVLNMPASRITRLSEGLKKFPYLTSLNLSESKFLTKTPDFSGISSLKVLNFDGCTSLVDVDPSVGFLNKLVKLTLARCCNLTSFPRVRLKGLEHFSLRGCKRLKYFPEILDEMESIDTIDASGSGLTEIPSSIIEHLTKLARLYLSSCENLTNLPCNIFELKNLRALNIDNCPKMNTIEESFPTDYSDIEPKELFTRINLSENNFATLPIWISKFVNLRFLELCACKMLVEIPDLPPKVEVVIADGCISLERLSDFENNRLICGHISLYNCHRLCDNLGKKERWENALQNQVSSCMRRRRFTIVYPESEVPKWFSCRTKDTDFIRHLGDSKTELCIEIPRKFKWKNAGLAICGVTEVPPKDRQPLKVTSLDSFAGGTGIGNNTFLTIFINGYKRVVPPLMVSSEMESTHVALEYYPRLFRSIYTETESPLFPLICRVEFAYNPDFKNYGIHLVNGTDDNDDDNHYEQDEYGGPWELEPTGQDIQQKWPGETSTKMAINGDNDGDADHDSLFHLEPSNTPERVNGASSSDTQMASVLELILRPSRITFLMVMQFSLLVLLAVSLGSLLEWQLE